jgi:hypothetical protein
MVALLIAIWGGTVASGDEVDPAPADSSINAPSTTSEFGTETEIVIALDEDGNVVPVSIAPND